MRYLRLLFSTLIAVFILNKTNAQQLAFPTAEGAGKFVTGGRGTSSLAPTVYEVTNLGDVNAAGSFRYAATVSGPSSRIIVFRIAGTIHLTSTLTLTRANTTIAGQTAPGDGICIADYPVYIGANNMIIRYLRFRLGDKNQNLGMVNGSGDGDAFGDNGSGRQKLIIDHCTASWSDDESFTIYKGDSTTIQWCMITEPLNYSYHFETGDADFEMHSFGGIWGGKHATFHHNLFAHVKGRAPRFDGIRNIAADSGDFRNNVIYDWASYNTNGGEGGAYNIVNNYYKYGPSTATNSSSGVLIKNMLINPYKQTSPAIPYGQFYLTGNYCDNSSVVTNDNWLGAAFSSGSFNDSIASRALTPFNCININMQTAQDAYNSVLANAGCFLPHRDTLDQRIVNDVINRTGGLIDVQGGYPHGTPYSTSQSAWPMLAAGNAPVDSDHDGMPDVWEIQRGLNPNNASDVNGYISTSGYSNIENYLNGDTITAPGILNTCIAAKQITAANSGNWINAMDTTYSSSLSPSYLASTDSMNVVASVFDNGNFGSFNVSYYTTGTLRYDQFNHPYLNRNITVAPVTPASITSGITVRIYFTNAEYDALKAADNTITSLNDLRVVKITGSSCITSLTGSAQIIIPVASGLCGTYQKGYFLEFTTNSLGTFFITSRSSLIPGTGDYQTHQSGDWTNLSTWERYDGTNWVTPAPAYPVYNNAGAISILSGHSVILTANITTDQTIINSGGSLVVNPGIVLTLNDGTGTDLTVSSGGSLTIRSTVAGTGSIGNSTTATITGDVTAERYISDKRAWRLLGVPFSASNQTIKASWMEGGTSPTNNPVPGYGTHITTFTGDGNASSFDGTKPASSIRIYSANSFTSDGTHTPNTTTLISANPAAFLFVRGNRGINLNTSTDHSATTLRIIGTVNTGAVTKGITGTSFSLIPNPYPSVIDFDLVKASNTSISTFYVWDATLGIVGQYRAVQITGSVAPYTYTATPGSANTSWRYIESGTAFFIPGTATVNFTEGMKTAGIPPSSMLRITSSNQTELAVNLNVVNADNTTSLADGIREVFDNNYSATVDNNDAKKITGFDLNLGISSNNEILAIEKRPLPNTQEVITLSLSNMAQGNYQFELQPANFSSQISLAYLKDNYLNTYTAVSLSADTKTNFTISADAASSSQNRFSILFGKPQLVNPNSLITVYPNPVSNGVVTMLMNNMPKGIYLVRLLNAEGQTILAKQINHAGGSNTETIKLNKVKGTYTIEVTKPDNSKTNNRIIIN